MAEPIDAVYTWVDDQLPGYQELLARFGRTRHDLNPNRTRDNLEMLKYSLRSLERYAPWVRHVYLVTCRPQVPAWLDPAAPNLTVVHHDELIDAAYLPTFNSFAIASSLYRLVGASERFLYVEDDYLFGRPVSLGDWLTSEGSFWLWTKLEASPSAPRPDDERHSPWTRALAHTNRLLDRAYRSERRRAVRHVPLLVDRGLYGAMVERWRGELERTWASRFRGPRNAAAEHLYPYYLWYEGLSRCVPLVRSYVESYYQGIDNGVPQQWLQFAFLRQLRPKLYSLNDNFGARPSPIVTRMARRYLEEAYPTPSRFERAV